jgi:hypothetical protein
MRNIEERRDRHENHTDFLEKHIVFPEKSGDSN